MSTSNTLEVFAHGEYRRFTLIRDDITSLRERIDLLILSSYGSQITGRTPGTVIHKLREKAGISLEQLKESPELDLTEQLNLWVSRETGNSDLRRIMCIQYETTNRPEHITEQAFRALPILESRGIVLNTIALPVLGTGSQGLDPDKLVPAIIAGAEWCMKTLTSVRSIYFVDHDEAHYEKLNVEMDKALHRARVTLPKTILFNEVREKFEEWPRKFEQKDPRLVALLAELREETRGDGRASQIGIAGRKIREYVIKAISPKMPSAPSQDDDGRVHSANQQTIYSELRKHKVADWLISYLNFLRVFGNEQAHSQADVVAQFPRQIVEQDLLVCLLIIDCVLEFWFEYHPSPAALRPSVA